MSTISLNPKSATPQGHRTLGASASSGAAANNSSLHQMSGPGLDLGATTNEGQAFAQLRSGYGVSEFNKMHSAGRIGSVAWKIEINPERYTTAA
jgi:hypothetical protein